MKPLHRVLILLLGAPLLIVVLAICAFLVNAALAEAKERAFLAVVKNSSRTAVVQALGNPDRVRPCGQHLWWGDDSKYLGENAGECSLEERYEYFLVAYGIGYSANGRVVAKYMYVSE